ncbi:MAG: 50S ribosomal protein L9 [Lachnospiraceae bacterium]|jgi:large subunit ribosomal protein L9
MKVLLTSDVKGKGKKGTVVNVADAYGRNVLIAKGLGVEATAVNMNNLKLHLQNEEKVKAENLAKAKELAAALKENTVKITIKVGENGRTFGSVSAKEIADAAGKQSGIELDKKKIVLPQPIKSLGSFEIPYKVHPQVEAAIKIVVEGE